MEHPAFRPGGATSPSACRCRRSARRPASRAGGCPRGGWRARPRAATFSSRSFRYPFSSPCTWATSPVRSLEFRHGRHLLRQGRRPRRGRPSDGGARARCPGREGAETLTAGRRRQGRAGPWGPAPRSPGDRDRPTLAAGPTRSGPGGGAGLRPPPPHATFAPATTSSEDDHHMGKRMRIAINTGGGDAPGLNAVIYAVDHGGRTSAAGRCYGIQRGLRRPLRHQQDHPAHPRAGARHHPPRRHHPRHHQQGQPLRAARHERPDGTDRVPRRARTSSWRTSSGSASTRWSPSAATARSRIAHRLSAEGAPGRRRAQDHRQRPGRRRSITFGFDTAVTIATEAIDKLHSTAEAHERVMVVEVMGRYAGWIALHGGLSGDRRRHPHPRDPLRHRQGLRQDHGERGRAASASRIVVVAEGAKAAGGAAGHQGETDGGRREEVRLGGVGRVGRPGDPRAHRQGDPLPRARPPAARRLARPPSTGSSRCASARPRSASSPRGSATSWWPGSRPTCWPSRSPR